MNNTAGNKIVGIDLGTTFSAISHINEHGKPETILNNDGTPTTPSAVLFESADNIVVGQLARDSAVSSPHNVVTLVKREMGRDTKFDPADQEFTPEEISAMILRKLKQDAESRLGMPITQAVITVPAYFGTAERKATEDAGEMAGLTVAHILNEPTAAALAFGLANPDREQTLLVYDLGGGTFDITLLKIRPPANGSLPDVEMISTGGNHDLGGVNWDERIIDYVAEQFAEQHGSDPRDNLASKQDLYIRCEKAKIALAKVAKTRIACQHDGQTVVVELDRGKLDELTADLLQLTVDEMDQLLADKGVAPESVDQVICAGGSTRLLTVREMLQRRFPGKVNTAIDPDQCVAQGAAWMGHLIAATKDGSGETITVTDVAPHALGVAALNEAKELRIYPLIPKDTQLPCGSKDTFYTSDGNQTGVEIKVYENEVRSKQEVTDLSAGQMIGEAIYLSGLPGGRPPGQPIEVTFSFDASFRLGVTAVDVNTGTTINAEFVLGSRLDTVQKENTAKMLADTEIQS